jgi:hypothetical protein
MTDVTETELILAKASYTPSGKASEKIKKNCDGCQRSQESKIPFRGSAVLRFTQGSYRPPRIIDNPED